MLLAVSAPPAHVIPAPSRKAIERIIALAAADTGVSLRLLRSVASHESGMRPEALSRAGAVGIMQTLPEVAHENGCANVRDVRCEIYAGARHLAKLLTRYRGDVRLALAAYNAGPGAVTHFGGVPPYAETRAYVAGILAEIMP